MRKFLLTAILTICYLIVSAQSGGELLFKSNEFVWCGLDYSNVKCIGTKGFEDPGPEKIKDQFFNSWNMLMLEEQEKFDFKKAYDFESQQTDLSVVERRNMTPSTSELIVTADYKFKKGQLKEIIADYNLEQVDKGLGLVYVVQSLNKRKQEAVIHVVFFDIASKEILWAHNYTAPSGGFGFRNYWAKPIYETIKVSKGSFKKDRNKFKKGKYK